MTVVPETASQAIRAAEAVLLCGIVLSAAEHLALGKHFNAGGIYAPPPELTGPGLTSRSCVSMLLSKTAFFTLAWIRLALAVLALSGAWPPGRFHAMELFLLALIGIMVNLRIPAGLEGSEQMTMIVLIGIALAALFPGNAFVEKCCVWFLALQAALAYATAGWAKVKVPAWRSGAFLTGMLSTDYYGHPGLARIFADPLRARLAGRFLMAFEASFPLALLDRRLAVVYLAAGLLFHIVNAFAMGLNSFIWPFVATYPAILYCSRAWHY